MSLSNHRGFRTTTWGQLVEAGYELWPTVQWDENGQPYPRSEVHYDVVLDASIDIPAWSGSRKALRQHLAPLYEEALTLFGDVTEL